MAYTCTNNSWGAKAGGVPWGSDLPRTSSGLSKSGLQNKNLSKRLKPKLKQNTVKNLIINRRPYWYWSIEEVNQAKQGTTYTYLLICRQKLFNIVFLLILENVKIPFIFEKPDKHSLLYLKYENFFVSHCR